MKLIAIDYGRRRIGLAVAEPGMGIRGLPTIDRKKHPDAVAAVARMIHQEAAESLVVGLPLSGDDRETPFAIEIKQFAQLLTDMVKLPVHFIDESFTSAKAQELLLFRRKKDRRNKGNHDRIAACLIMDAFLKESAACVS
jgi:putative holliday junction resolvase